MDAKPLHDKIAKVIIIAGFLGSGKTTLVESILQAPELNKKVAVIQNEFSANMGMESMLMKDANGNDVEDFYEMPNGCICCAAKDDLINTLDALLEKKSDIDYILVETNGLADSSQLVQTFWLDDEVGSRVQLHQTIALVDCLYFRKHADSTVVPKDEDDMNTFPENELLLRQLVHADKILLNKVDLLEQACSKDGKDIQSEVDHIRQCIAHVNKHASLQETKYAKADLEFLISKPTLDQRKVELLKKEKLEEAEAKKLKDSDAKQHNHNHGHDHDHGHDENDEHKLSHAIIESIKSIYIPITLSDGKNTIPSLDRDKLEFLIGELLWEGPATRGIQIMRCKGIFEDVKSGKTMMLQGVEDLFEFREVDGQAEKKCIFLFVGKGPIEENQLKNEILEKCGPQSS